VLKLAFTRTERRTQRRSDGTVVIENRRFEVPNAYRHLERLLVRYASWDLTQVHLVDEHSSQVLCRLYPEDKTRNANGVRRPLDPVASRTSAGEPVAVNPVTGIAPLLAELMSQQAATGLPPPYLPKDESSDNEGEKL
jgi:hypothetical protein